MSNCKYSKYDCSYPCHAPLLGKYDCECRWCVFNVNFNKKRIMETGLIEVEVIDNPEEAFRKLMAMWPEKPPKRHYASFRDLPPEAQKHLEKQYNKIFGKETNND